jgi:hypothetical protein
MGGRGHLRPLSVCRREVLNEGVWYEQRGPPPPPDCNCRLPFALAPQESKSQAGKTCKLFCSLLKHMLRGIPK